MSGEGGGMQQVQVLPVQNSGGASGQPIMLQSQVIQTADGETLVYQPVQVDEWAEIKFICPKDLISLKSKKKFKS